MVPLAMALAGRGHDVRWAVVAEAGRPLEAAGFATFPAGMGVAEREAAFRRLYADAGSLPPQQRPDFMFPAFFGQACPPKMLDDLLPVVEAWRPALIVNEAAELAGPLAATLAGLPHVTHAFGALIPEHRMAAAAAAVAPLWQAHGREPSPYAGMCLPQAADQFINAGQGAVAGAAIALARTKRRPMPSATRSVDCWTSPALAMGRAGSARRSKACRAPTKWESFSKACRD